MKDMAFLLLSAPGGAVQRRHHRAHTARPNAFEDPPGKRCGSPPLFPFQGVELRRRKESEENPDWISRLSLPGGFLWLPTFGCVGENGGRRFRTLRKLVPAREPQRLLNTWQPRHLCESQRRFQAAEAWKRPRGAG